MNYDYIKDYRGKELKQYVIAYLLMLMCSIGLNASFSGVNSFSEVLNILSLDLLAGAICILVLIFNELWSDKAKIAMVYGTFPSDTIFTDIKNGEKYLTGFDFHKAQELYVDYAELSSTEQTVKWNLLLRKSKESAQGNVIEAQRLQLMTRDICISTVSLIILSLASLAVLTFIRNDFCSSISIFGFPMIYLSVMFFITKKAALNRAKRLVALVIKNDVQQQAQ